MKRLIILFIVLRLSFASASNNSLTEQQVALEHKLRTRVENAVGAVLSSKDYFVEVVVKFNDPGGPNFNGLEKVGIRVSDIEFDDSKGDYIAFSKVGLEVPVVEKMYKQNQQYLQEVHRFNEAYDLFKNLESVSIEVFISDLVAQEKVDKAKLVVENLKFNLGEIKPKVEFKTLAYQIPEKKPDDLAKPEDIKDEGITFKDILDFLSRFGNAIGAIIATILLGLFARYLLKRYFEELKNLARPEEETKDEDEKAPEEEVVAEGEVASNNEAQAVKEASKDYFARFASLLQKSPRDATGLVKRWIHQSDFSAQNALVALAQQLSPEEMEQIFEGLGPLEREMWKNSLDQFLDDTLLSSTNQFIADEVIRETVGAKWITEEGLVDLILGLSPQDTLSFVKDHPEQGTVLLNLLSPTALAKLMDEADKEMIPELISRAGQISEQNPSQSELKKALTTHLHKIQGLLPFRRKVLKMLDDFNPEKEEVLYQYLISSGMKKEIIHAASKNVPLEIVYQLPAHILKVLLNQYPAQKRIEFLMVTAEDKRENLIKIFAPEGSTAKEMLNMEMQTVQGDNEYTKRLENNRGQVTAEFVQFVRSYLKLHPEYLNDVEAQVSAWANQKVKTFKDAGGVAA